MTASFYPSIGGVETYILELGKKMQLHGYQIYVVTSHRPNTATYEIYDSIHIYRFPAIFLFDGRLNTILPSRRLYTFLKTKVLSKRAIIITNTRFYLGSVLCARYANKHQLPAIHIEHGSGHIALSSDLANQLGRIYDHVLGTLLRKSIQYAFGVSKASSSWLEHFGIISSGELYNAIDDKGTISNIDFRGYLNNSQDILVTYVGRITEDKGYRDLIDAFLKAYEINTNMMLLIAGDGPQFDKMNLKITGHDHIRALGAISHPDVMKLLNDSDVFVFPSKCKEGMPTTVLEAGLMKCAIIATPQGGVPEVVEHERNGLIVNPSDISNMADYILNLSTHPDLIIQYGASVHEKIVNQFSWSVVANKLDQVIKSMNQ